MAVRNVLPLAFELCGLMGFYQESGVGQETHAPADREIGATFIRYIVRRAWVQESESRLQMAWLMRARQTSRLRIDIVSNKGGAFLRPQTATLMG